MKSNASIAAASDGASGSSFPSPDWEWEWARAMAALWGTVRLESCFPPFLRRGAVLVRVRGLLRLGRRKKKGGGRRRGRGVLAMGMVVGMVGMRRVWGGGLIRIFFFGGREGGVVGEVQFGALELPKEGRASTFFDTLFRVALGFFERTAVHFHVLVLQFWLQFW